MTSGSNFLFTTKYILWYDEIYNNNVFWNKELCIPGISVGMSRQISGPDLALVVPQKKNAHIS